MFAVIVTTHLLISNQNKQHKELLEQQKMMFKWQQTLMIKREKGIIFHFNWTK